MKAKEKAKELVNKFARSVEGNKTFNQRVSESIVLSIIAVDEILKSDPLSPAKFDDSIDKLAAYNKCEEESYQFWQEVKQEIEKL